MIFITGGIAQGKRAFAEKLAGGPLDWTDGETADWDAFMRGPFCCNFHLFIRRVLLGRASFPKPSGAGQGLCRSGEGPEWAGEKIVRSLFWENPDRILLTDDIGGGVVPVDPFERMYREETGRICCQVARDAREVWRVCCGLGQRIK